ncbi:ATP-binding protein [Sediminicoccus rosea]|uniref:ATP-binding protein n=1 Tax=Sediminicoccus rosea TaxID=1225128 RepID=A0ABZ0PKW3_9PROT|nr:ATP-binding protein [Sediminicoccus rosea]WPB86385.1 ATP-binding protein [Sediminicoccus rosea]
MHDQVDNLRAHDGGNEPSLNRSLSTSAADAIQKLTRSQLEHALDAHHRGLKVYESLKSLNDVIGTQYGERVLYELLQNAHDAHALDEKGEIAVRLVIHNDATGELLVANRGRPFSASNLDSIRNIGTSDKKIGEGIGNKGLGFRSVEALTDDVRIFSAASEQTSSRFDGFCFRFATISEIAARLREIGADAAKAETVAANVPRYLVPVVVEEQSEEVLRLAQRGYATVVCLPLTSARAVDLARKQVAAVLEEAAPLQLFLDRLASLDVAVVTSGQLTQRKRLSRHVEAVPASGLPPNFRMEKVTLDARNAFLIVRQTLPKDAVLSAVRDSIPAAPPLKRWLDWKGDAVVSVAVPLGPTPLAQPRCFNFLPMDKQAVSPMAGHIDAPFFADIDRRSIKPDLALNRFLLQSVAVTAATAAIAIVDHDMPLPANAVIDLTAWSGPHMHKVIAAFQALGRPLSTAAVWPLTSGGSKRWASLETLYAWPEIRTKQLTPSRLAYLAKADILSRQIGESRLARIREIAVAISLPITPNGDTLCQWVEAVAEYLVSSGRQARGRWRDFYDDIVTFFSASSVSLEALVGKRIFLGSDDKLLVATAKGLDGAPPVFCRVGRERGKRSEGPPSPPSALSRKFRFLSQSVDVSDAAFRAFEKAGLLRRYDPIEALAGLKGALSGTATEIQRREAMTWAFRVWRSAGGRSVEEALRDADLLVPCFGGWRLAREASLSGTWSALGRTLEQYLHEAALHSTDCRFARDGLLVNYGEWPRSATDDRREDWLRFLTILGVRDGLQPIAGVTRRKGTPSGYWNRLFQLGQQDIGLDVHWTNEARAKNLSYPMTDYLLGGEIWRVPGQVEHQALPGSAKEALSDLLVAYLRDSGDAHFTFRVAHHRGFQTIELPTPLQIFLREGEWVASLRRDETVFATPRASWSTSAARQHPPRFVPRFGAEPGSRTGLPPILFDARVGLRDWASPASAPERLETLASVLLDLAAAERRDLRDQIRRAWHDVAEQRSAIPPRLELVVERAGILDLCSPDAESPPTVYVTGERQGFAARALADAGEAVLDVGEADGAVICDLLVSTGVYAPRLADSGDVQFVVDGDTFEPSANDPLLVAGDLSWLSSAAVLAHEYLGDPLELRTLPTDEIERRLRQIRVRRCRHFALTIADQVIPVRGHERTQAVPHTRVPTLLVSGDEPIGMDLLFEASPALTKLVGSRRNTLETMLSRLAREGFTGAAAGPTELMLARAIRRDVGVVRDYLAAMRGGVERRVAAVLPVVAFLKGRDAAERLSDRHFRLGPALRLREWLAGEFEVGLAERILSAVDETDDQRVIRERLGFDFAAYGRTLVELGYPPLNDEADFRRLFAVLLAEMTPSLRERLRRKFIIVWRASKDLAEYVALRQLDFISFDPAWTLERENIDLSFVASHAAAAMEAKLGPDDPSIALPALDAVTSTNRKLVLSRYARLTSLIRAWCRVNGAVRPVLTESADPQPLVRALDQAGLIDFDNLRSDELPALLRRVNAWPAGMPTADTLDVLGLTEADLQHEEREARETRRKAEVARRTIEFGGKPIDTGGDDFAIVFEQLASAALTEGNDWYNRSRPPRLRLQDHADEERRRPGTRGGKGGDWRQQLPEAVRTAMGVASEWLAREYLRRRHPKEMTDACWVSSNRQAFCTGAPGDDSLGYDFCVQTMRHEYLYEVKSALDDGGEFELTARELEVASSASLDRKRRYRILYVPHVFDPKRWRVLPLLNPVGSDTRSRFRVVRSGSVRYRFEVR